MMTQIDTFGKIISKLKSEQELIKNRTQEVKKSDGEDTKFKYENSILKNKIDSYALDLEEHQKNLEKQKNKNLDLENNIQDLTVK